MSRLYRALVSPAGVRAIGEPIFRLAGRRPPLRGGPLSGARRILVVRLDKIGDGILASAFLRELRANRPRARIDLVVRPAVRPLVERCPHVDHVLTFDPPTGMRLWRLARHARALRLAATRLFGVRYDLALCPRFDADLSHAAYLAYLSGAPRRAAFTERSTPDRRAWNPGEDRLFTDVFEEPGIRHDADMNLRFLERLGGRVSDRRLELWAGPEDERAAERALADAAPGPAGFAVLAPGADAPKRRWPIDRFAAVGLALRRRYGLAVIVTGGPMDAAAGAALAAAIGPGATNLAGRLDLRASGVLLAGARLFVGNDTGTMHLAAAAGAPVVAISCHPAGGDPDHPNSPRRFGPRGERCELLRPARPAPPCRTACEAREPHCILGVAVSAVLAAATRAMKRR